MAKKLQSIYDYLKDYSIQEIDKVISQLSSVEQQLIHERYGDNLYDPQPTLEWNSFKNARFYGSLIPKIRRLLKKKRRVQDNNKSLDYTLFLEILKSDKTNQEICQELGISSAQLAEELLKLQMMGFKYGRKYYSDGSIKYKRFYSFRDLPVASAVAKETIITKPNENKMKLLVMSDLHFGNELERMDLVHRAYDYCIKNNIHIILCTGDIVDGSFSRDKQKITDLAQQVEYFLKNYPYDSSILTFEVAGDHDASVFQKISLDIVQACQNYRHDIIIEGYNNAFVNIKKDNILLCHQISGEAMDGVVTPIVLLGHTHRYATTFKDNVLNVHVPSLSDIITSMPSVLELTLHFSEGCIDEALVKQIYFGQKDFLLNESYFDFSRFTTTESSKFDSPVMVRALENHARRLNQVEKFYNKYGRK